MQISTTDKISMIPHFQAEELLDALIDMEKKQAADGGGIIAEMLRCGSDQFRDLFLDFFTHILESACPP